MWVFFSPISCSPTLHHELFEGFSILFLPVILVQVDVNFSHPKNAFPEMAWLFFLYVFWQSLIWSCLHLVLNPLYLLWWSLLLVVDFNSDCLLESVLLLAGCCERGSLYHGEDSPIIHHCCPPWTSVRSFFSEWTKLLIWPLLVFLSSFSDVFV